ncbi:MAG: HD-like signal output (HDOD) protein/prolyl-tRNA editing enzyme YbaK/EbsC (Cys-tRNA(Pro) deacylase) [Candidatus Endobugula sp.]
MAVPVSIEQHLKKHNISYSLATILDTPLSEVNSSVQSITQRQHVQSANAHLLQNTHGEKLLAITPKQTILNLDAVKETFGEPYKPIVGKSLSTFIHSLGLDAMVAMPKLGNLPTIVDSNLLKTDMLLLSVGVNNEYIQVDGESFKKLLESTIVDDISTPLSTLNQAISTHLDEKNISASVEKFTELRIKQRLTDTLELPPLPATAAAIIKLRVDTNADVNDLCEVIELDPVLAAQVVSWASSPYYSAPGTIKSIHDAIVRVLGFDMVLSLSLGLALGSTLKLPNRRPEGCVSYWQQAVYVSTCTEAIISCMPREHRPSYGCSYLSGLLHNFGYLVIAEVFDNKFDAICNEVDANTHAAPQSIEKHIIGVTRDQLAGWLMESWDMPEEVCAAIRHQSDQEYAGEHAEYSRLIYLTRKLLNEKGVRTGVSNAPIPEKLFKNFNLDRQEVSAAIDVMLESTEMLEAMTLQMSHR